MGGILHHMHHNYKAQCEGESQSQINILPESHWMTDLIAALPDSVSIFARDAQTNRYLLANNRAAELYGARSVNDLIGISLREFWIEDICHRRSRLRLSDNVVRCEKEEVERVEQCEAKVRVTKLPVIFNSAIIKYDDSILYERIKKFPVLDGNKNKVVATITLTEDLTSQIHLPDLFQLYRRYYPDFQAIQQLSKYLKIDSYFTKLPTVREMQILLALCGQSNRKKISRLLNVSHNTLASHLQHLKEKLIVPDINELLTRLRTAPMNQRPFNQICASESA